MRANGSNEDPKTVAIPYSSPVASRDPKVKVPPCIVLLNGPAKYMGRQWNIDRAEMVLGRTSGADIHIEEISLSKAHAKFTLLNDEASIMDLGATNKTYVNGVALAPQMPHALKNNDQIRAGNAIFKFLQKGILSETAEKSRMQSELELARNVQTSLFPAQLQQRYGVVQIGGRYRTATECGGDWWWHWASGERAFALIGDATGHGAGAALITSAARSAVTTMEDDAGITIEKVYTTLSRALHRCAAGAITMSAFIVEVNTQNRSLRYINASHLPAVWLPPTVQSLDWKKLDFITEGLAPPLGSPHPEFSVGSSQGHPGFRLALLTDGLTERKNTVGRVITDREFYKMLMQVHFLNVGNQTAFLDSLLLRSDERVQNAVQDDDITVVAIDFPTL